MIYVRVPATSANMGAGFDSLGIAVGLYNTLRICETQGGISVYNNSSDYIPIGEKNLVYRAICRVFDTVGYKKKGIKIIQNSEIPVTRGLGSSSACIVGGMLAANVISGRQLSYQEILSLAAEMEGHPDNVTPALFGGFCVSAKEEGRVLYTSNKIGMKLAVMIPGFYTSTRESRVALPESVPLPDCAYNISRASLLTSMLMGGQFDSLKYAVGDKIHQQARGRNIEAFEEILEKSYEYGAYATYLSGSGPTIVSMIPEDSGFKEQMTAYLSNLTSNWQCKVVPVDNVGAILKEY